MQPRVFTKDDPCTKVELHNCFYRNGQYVERAVVEAKAEIGENAPKYLLKMGFVLAQTRRWVDYYVPTDSGREWLKQGIQRYLVLHPERISDCKELPPGFVRSNARTPKATVQTWVSQRGAPMARPLGTTRTAGELPKRTDSCRASLNSRASPLPRLPW